jgi:carboxylesterase type B
MADSFGSQCPQSPPAIPPGAAKGTFASEDCLFVNIYAPPGATDLPVLVWIHGGGYGAGNGQEDLSAIIGSNNNTFVGVSIQYRV